MNSYRCTTVDPSGAMGCTLFSGHVGPCRNAGWYWCGYCGLPDGAHRQDCPTRKARVGL